MGLKEYLLLLLMLVNSINGQVAGNEKRYVSIGSLQSHFSAYGSERAWNGIYYEGLRWPADFPLQDNSVIKRTWLAVEDYSDSAGTFYDHYGLYFYHSNYSSDVGTTLFPIELSQTAKHPRPLVRVNGISGNYSQFDIIDAIDPNQIPDRIITNVVNTSMGLTQTREVLAFGQEYHDNYFIKIFRFTNTGNIDYDDDIELTDSLRGVRIGWGTRYSCGREAASIYDGSLAYGKHNWVTRRGEDYAAHYMEPITEQNPIADWLRAAFSWMGQSEYLPWDNIGGPDALGDGCLLSPHFVGSVVLHVDISSNDPADDLNQPNTLGWHAGDRYPSLSQVTEEEYFDNLYSFLSGNPYPDETFGGINRMDDALESITHRLDPYTIHGDGGGTNMMMTYGPYDLAHGESITIVEAEGINGLSRELCQQIGERWKLAYANPGDIGPFTLPNGVETDNLDIFKNSWVYTGQDSILKTFGRAKRNFDSGFQLVLPPLPPSSFDVQSDTAQILLSWEASPSELTPSFNGYHIYRAVGSDSSPFQIIAELEPGSVNYTDTALDLGRLYFYYIVAVSDGSENAAGDVNPEGPLKSNRFYTKTTQGAFPLSPSHLDDLAGDYRFELEQNFPNPFNPLTKIKYSLDKVADINLRIFDVRGHLVRHAALASQKAGEYEFLWNACNDFGEAVPTGVYYFQIQSARKTETIKMLHLK